MKSGKAKLTLCCRTLAAVTFLAALVLACQASSDAVRLSGTIRTAVGEVPVLAHVHLVDVEGGEALESVEAGPGGAFELAVPRAGSYRLVVSAVDHEPVRIPLVFGGEEAVELHLSLRRTPFYDDPEVVMAALEKPGEQPAVSYVNLERRDDGSWTKTVEDLKGERLRYHVFEVAANDRLVNGTGADAFEYDGGGDYYSVVAVEDGRAEVAFDPAALPPASEEARPVVDSSSPAIVRAYEQDRDAEAVAAKERRESQERGDALVERIFQAKQDGDEERWSELHAQLVDEFGEDRRFRVYVNTLNPRKRIVVGKTVPEFELALLDGGSGKVSDQSLRGRYVLIDFWATWCVPCVAELPRIQQAWERWGGERFQILSLSFDEKPEDVGPFRAERFPMPWLHAFVEKGQQSDLAKELEVFGIPCPVLVDPEGKIVAIQETLRGDKIFDTLAEHLGDGASG